MSTYTFSNQLPLWSFQFKSSSKIEFISRQEIEAKLITKALKDDEFKKELRSDPKASIKELTGCEIPGELSIELVDETESVVYLVLPSNPYNGLTEEEIRKATNMDLEEICDWVLNNQKGLFPDNREMNVQMVLKAWKDEAFKRLLLADPKVIIEQLLEEKVGDGITIIVLEETREKIFIVLPYLKDTALYLNEVDMHAINMPMVIGSHQNTAGFLGDCDKGNTHNDRLFCLDTRSDSQECKGVVTIYPGYNGCGGVCRFFSLLPG